MSAKRKAHLAVHLEEWQVQLPSLKEGWWINNFLRNPYRRNFESQVPDEGWYLEKTNRGAVVAPSPIILWEE